MAACTKTEFVLENQCRCAADSRRYLHSICAEDRHLQIFKIVIISNALGLGEVTKGVIVDREESRTKH